MVTLPVNIETVGTRTSPGFAGDTRVSELVTWKGLFRSVDQSET